MAPSCLVVASSWWEKFWAVCSAVMDTGNAPPQPGPPQCRWPKLSLQEAPPQGDSLQSSSPEAPQIWSKTVDQGQLEERQGEPSDETQVSPYRQEERKKGGRYWGQETMSSSPLLGFPINPSLFPSEPHSTPTVGLTFWLILLRLRLFTFFWISRRDLW